MEEADLDEGGGFWVEVVGEAVFEAVAVGIEDKIGDGAEFVEEAGVEGIGAAEVGEEGEAAVAVAGGGGGLVKFGEGVEPMAGDIEGEAEAMV